MTRIDWYYARGNKQTGPVGSAELKQLAATGQLRPEDLVWREGLTEWAPASSVRGLFDEETKPAAEEAASKPTVAVAKPIEAESPVPTPPAAPRPAMRHPVDLLLDSLRSDFNARFVDATARAFRVCGLYGLLLGLAFTLVFAVLVATYSSMLENILWGATLLLLCAFQYVAGKSCDALDRISRAGNVTLTATTLPDCFALLSLTAALVIPFISVPLAVSMAVYPLILLGIVGFIVCIYLAFVAINPSTLNVAIVSEEIDTSGEALNVLAFLLKVLVRAVPVALGAGVMAGALIMAYACYEALSLPGQLSASQLTASAARGTLLASAALPLAAYLLSLLCWLLLDLCRSILVSPRKPLDVLREEQRADDKQSAED
jgi:hypothetical protein